MDLQVLLCGVGGQGILFATRILSEAAMRSGQQVIGSETHGMSQRGGSVTSHMKVGDYRGPLIRRGDADVIFCFEKGEIFGNLTFLKPGGTIYIDAPDLDFIPKNVLSLLDEKGMTIHHMDASVQAMKMKAPLVLNLILIGFAARHEDFLISEEDLVEVITSVSPVKFKEMNLKAFHIGLGKHILEEL
ncbi:indolepyruvate ferredoxin oxidoreductase [candidate division LCP-89 bacterium B3_LCP]|uniref:Indolepyruvate ferredoxin oxidoreductase n=1 Tax=candidate division LCP-89 bacterium B3_LCP TaxID=2012998 RepID=A0A532V5B3_UNCL8|nr:MAG: indolepyruvate ferredoxin oxidoreductase [candidate division LCP-89 bacterium B3_LCP]